MNIRIINVKHQAQTSQSEKYPTAIIKAQIRADLCQIMKLKFFAKLVPTHLNV